MIGKIEFPEGITWSQKYINGGDFLGEEFSLPGSMASFYANAKNSVIDIKFDTSKVTNMSYMFNNCSNLSSITQFDTSSVTDMSSMFSGCTSLMEIPQLDTSNVTDMSSMFLNCGKLTTIPQLDTSNVKSMNRMFTFTNFTTIPQLDTSNVTDMKNMFQTCEELTTLPDFNTVKMTNFGASYDTWLHYCYNIQKIGVVDCDSATNVDWFFGEASRTYLTEFGGCRNLGKASSLSNTNSNYFMNYAPNLTYESVMNVINGLYDRATAGLSVLTLKLHANHLAMLSEDDIAIATNKGWTIV